MAKATKQDPRVKTIKRKTLSTVVRASGPREGVRLGSVRQMSNGKWRAIGKGGTPLATRVGGGKAKRTTGHATKAAAVNRVARGTLGKRPKK